MCRYLLIDQLDEKPTVFASQLPDLSRAANLEFLSATNQNFTGKAVLPPQLRVADFQDNHITGFEMANSTLPSQLAVINLSGNDLSINLSEMPGLPNLLSLNMNSNNVTSFPRGLSSRMHSLDLAENNIRVRMIC